MLRISKMPACLASTRNTVLSLILVCTVAVTVTSNMPSATGWASTPSWMSTVGCSCSSRMAGRIGLLQRDVLQVDALDLENGILVAVGHGESFECQKQSPPGSAPAGGAVLQVAGDYRQARPARAQAALQQRHQAAAAVERHQVVAAAHVGVADEDLRHGAPAGDLHHAAGARSGSHVDADLLDLLDALGLRICLARMQ